ncbi:MAG: ATP-binding protein [Candidatus Aminicenantes bacterium]|nr:ATP-binding protein [Candidatus Aminicenantes bacterium]
MSKDVYYEYNPWWESEGEVGLENWVERPMVLDQMDKFFESANIVLLTGLRRVGKTTLMKLFIQRLIKRGIAPGNIFYVSLDDYVLEPKSILDITTEYRTLHKLPVEEKVYFFFDEITHKENFHQQLKNLYDRQNVKIYAAASSSSILKDKKAYLTGRANILEVLPLDFLEYLQFKNITVKKKDSRLLEAYFDEYLQTGGIPGYVLYKEREYLQNLVDDIIYKDIIAYHKIKNHQVVKDLFKILMANVGNPISTYKIGNTLKISADTVSRYLQHFEDTYLIYLTPRCGKLNQQLSSPRKIYAADTGIRNSFTGYINKGRVFENYVYLKVKNFNPVYVFENQVEIDFYLDNKVLVEVKYGEELREKQKEFFDKFKASRKLVIKGYDDLAELYEILRIS